MLDAVDLSLSDGDVLGLVGDNGAGKSTLLWLLSGRRKPTRGSITHVGTRVLGSQELEAPFEATGDNLVAEALGPAHRRLAELEQAATSLAVATEADSAKAEDAYSRIFSDVMAHDDFNADHNAEVVLDHLGLSGDNASGALLSSPIAELSGGQRARLGLALTLIRKPEILLLDEPTNHLDARGRELVINTIQDHPGIVVVATHDRDFLDAVCTAIGDLVVGRPGLELFRGNYTAYDRHRRHARQLWEHQWRVENAERASLEETIASASEEAGPIRAKRDNEKMGYGHAAGRADRQVARRIRSARRRLEELEEDGVAKPPALLGFDAPLTAPLSTKRAPAGSDEDFHIKMRGVIIPDRLRVGSLIIRPGDKVVITGRNGAGKSTLLRAITDEVTPEAGEIRIGQQARVAMLAQEQHWKDPQATPQELYDALHRVNPANRITLEDLGLLTQRDCQRPVGDLSVGQQRRVALALITGNPPDVLLLDEPTNHLSVELIEEVQDAIEAAESTVLVVTHDRRMVDRLAARHLSVDDGEVFELPKGQKPVEFD